MVVDPEHFAFGADNGQAGSGTGEVHIEGNPVGDLDYSLDCSIDRAVVHLEAVHSA